MDYFDLLRIEDNLGIIEWRNNNDKPYYLYEYEYPVMIGDACSTSTDYTTIPNHSSLEYTGRVYYVYYKYKGYKIEYYEDNGQSHARLVSSDWVDNLLDIKNDYAYFSYYDIKYNHKFSYGPYLDENILKRK